MDMIRFMVCAPHGLELHTYDHAREIRIGRSRESTIQVIEPTVSRRHAVIHRTAVGYVLRDLSRCGTWLNRKRVSVALLKPGDVLWIGGVTLDIQDIELATTPVGTDLVPNLG
jgi:pSer/pThr/pTyr-binding forkhead associated (FHA) protein